MNTKINFKIKINDDVNNLPKNVCQYPIHKSPLNICDFVVYSQIIFKSTLDTDVT